MAPTRPRCNCLRAANSSSSISPLSSRTLSPAPIPGPQPASTGVTSQRTLISSSLRSKVRGLRNHAAWTFRHIAEEIGIAVSTIFTICQAPATSHKVKPGRPRILTSPIHKRLIDFATASQKNRRLPLREVAELAGVNASSDVLRTAFATEGYHRPVAQTRPFLSLNAKEKRFDWAEHYANWTRADWNKVSTPSIL